MLAQVRSRQIVGEVFLERLWQDLGSFSIPVTSISSLWASRMVAMPAVTPRGRHRDVDGPIGAVGGDGLGGEVHDPGA
ncbi:MAG TPA: hypothetical protein QGH28_09245 [Chloroflexota bacterium]|nr:hypothetical protein [Chloroflexota bacterium]